MIWRDVKFWHGGDRNCIFEMEEGVMTDLVSPGRVLAAQYSIIKGSVNC